MPDLPIAARDPHSGKRRRRKPKSTDKPDPRKRIHAARAPPDVGERLVRMHELEQLVGLKKPTINRLIADGRFPDRIHPLGNRMSAWRWSEVKAWIDARAVGKPALKENWK
jgi:predicted DNA-binding transcriptional regulator AlpA